MKHSSREELLACIEREHATLVALLGKIPLSRYKENGVWGDGWSVHDLVTHLTEWQQMLLRWIDESHRGLRPVIPAPGFKWSQTPALNRAIQQKYSHVAVRTALDQFSRSCETVHSLARDVSEAELLERGFFNWSGNVPLITYLAADTCSHYRFASKVLKRWMKSKGACRKGA